MGQGENPEILTTWLDTETGSEVSWILGTQSIFMSPVRMRVRKAYENHVNKIQIKS